MPSDSRTSNGLTRREELLAVATKLFAARGYHGTRMDDVADVIGLNKATVYHYYASKSLILFDIYRQAADGTLAAVAIAVSTNSVSAPTRPDRSDKLIPAPPTGGCTTHHPRVKNKTAATPIATM